MRTEQKILSHAKLLKLQVQLFLQSFFPADILAYRMKERQSMQIAGTSARPDYGQLEKSDKLFFKSEVKRADFRTKCKSKAQLPKFNCVPIILPTSDKKAFNLPTKLKQTVLSLSYTMYLLHRKHISKNMLRCR